MKQFLFAMGSALLLAAPATARPFLPTPLHTAFFQSSPVRGVIKNDAGEPLAGVTIQVNGTSNTTLSGADGSFSIEVPAASKTLSFSYVGMESQQVAVAGKSTLNVQLKALENTLSDVIVVGYGTQKEGQPDRFGFNGHPVRCLPNGQRRIRPTCCKAAYAGLQVTQPSAEPGRDNPAFLIRGRGSFGGSTAPLVLIDGVTGSFNNLSPDDIENVTVLKDAASASIYGARAANGVILVTTKKGKRGQMTVSYRGNVRGTCRPSCPT